jgi:hypothetical protein
LRRVTFIGPPALAVLLGASSSALAWTAPAIIDSRGTNGFPSTSLVISPSDMAFVAWVRGSSDLFWSQETASSWQKTKVAGSHALGNCFDATNGWRTAGPSAAITSGGEPKIATACLPVTDGAKIYYSQLVSGVWKTQFVGYGPITSNGSPDATTLALALSSTDQPSIVMTDKGSEDITRFRLVRGVWKRQQLVKGVSVCCEFVQYKLLDASYDPATGRLGVAWTFRFGDTGTLSYAKFNAKGALVGAIQSVPVGTTNVYGRPSLAYLSNGDAAIAVQRTTSSGLGLAVAVRSSGAWTIKTVDSSAADLGLNPLLDTTGDVFHVAYPDDTNGDLKYASSLDGITWITGTVVSSGDIGDFPSAGVTSTGGVEISYFDSGHTALKSVAGP